MTERIGNTRSDASVLDWLRSSRNREEAVKLPRLSREAPALASVEGCVSVGGGLDGVTGGEPGLEDAPAGFFAGGSMVEQDGGDLKAPSAGRCL